MRAVLATFLVLCSAMLIPASPAAARPCSDRVPVFVGGVQWIVYTGDSARERREISCAKARRIAKRAIRTGHKQGWRCSRRKQRCVRGGWYTDDFGHRTPRYLVGWHRAD